VTLQKYGSARECLRHTTKVLTCQHRGSEDEKYRASPSVSPQSETPRPSLPAFAPIEYSTLPNAVLQRTQVPSNLSKVQAASASARSNFNSAPKGLCGETLPLDARYLTAAGVAAGVEWGMAAEDTEKAAEELLGLTRTSREM
jgi:hypothetical protein